MYLPLFFLNGRGFERKPEKTVAVFKNAVKTDPQREISQKIRLFFFEKTGGGSIIEGLKGVFSDWLVVKKAVWT